MTAATESTRDSVRSALESVKVVAEHYRDQGEQERRLPDAVVAAMREAGLFKLWAPVEHGGSQVELAVFMDAVEELARVDAAAAWTFANLAAGAVLAAHLPTLGAKEIYAQGPSVRLPGAVTPKGRAVPAPGGYRLSGRWPLGSGCHHGDWLSGVAMVFDGEAPRMGPGGAPDFQVMFFRPEAAHILDTWHSVGLRGTGSTDFMVDDVFVPEHLAFPLFTAQPQVSGPLYTIGILPLFSMALTPVLLGVARAAIDAFVELAKQKTPTLSQTGLATRPTVHAEVARAEALLQSSRALLYEVAAELMRVVTSGQRVPEALEARRILACVHAGASCRSVVDMMFALAGATPVYSGHPLERAMRDMHAASQHLVVSPVWWEKTGQYYFGLGLGMP